MTGETYKYHTVYYPKCTVNLSSSVYITILPHSRRMKLIGCKLYVKDILRCHALMTFHKKTMVALFQEQILTAKLTQVENVLKFQSMYIYRWTVISYIILN